MAQRQFRSDDTSIWIDKYGNGSDGVYAPSSGTDAPIDSAASGTSGTTTLTATNAGFAIGQLILIHQTQGTGAGNWELNKISNYSAGTITTAYSLINTYGTGAQVLVMPQYSSGLIDTGVTLTLKAWNGTVGGIFAKFCNGTFSIVGTLTGTTKGFRGQAGNSSGKAHQGEGTVGIGTTSSDANGNGGGGDPDYQNRSGAGGGNANAGANGYLGSSTGGSASGNAGLTLITFGGAGGSATVSSADALGGNGGAIAIIIAKTITITGSIALTGGQGVWVNSAPGSGSGAGGSCLLKGQTITLGSNLITAVNGTITSGNPAGGLGSVGRIHADYSSSVTGTTTPTIDTTQDSSLSASSPAGSMFNVFY